ncbi:Serine/threonine kinase PKN8 [Labilithrix luteola]|uniref:Serine/threonine kinase PKN8 n=1 Tax=Labilithrix luteola TaxID=1391654 RepID=A0A0K1PS90_9BACT|nr:serine/threonine-protein kinase [Labilithrix luteola]AKU96221.1 Serine/threonine kinase PKN8 [Labilithrix luteola]
MRCLDENELSAHLAGRFNPGARDPDATERITEHLDECATCADLMMALARAYPVEPPLTGVPHSMDITEIMSRAPLDPYAPQRKETGEEAPPTQIGRYVVLAPLGTGGMGVVYAAYDPKLDRKVAIKLLRGRSGEDEQARHAQRTLMREARTMARISHPNVLAVHDVGSHDGHVFLVMDFVDGGTLRHWLRSHRHEPGEILKAVLHAGSGLVAAHKAGLVHRDFKPDNVLVSRDGRVLVADFGLTSATPSIGGIRSPDGGGAAGTPGYMAPEVRLGAEADERSDQYSFCVTLHESLLGERPPEDRPSDVLERAFGIPDAVKVAIRRGLSPAPQGRFSSMQALLDELAANVPEVTPTRATPLPGSFASAVVTTVSSRRKRSVWPLAVASFAVVVLSGLTLHFVSSGARPTAAASVTEASKTATSAASDTRAGDLPPAFPTLSAPAPPTTSSASPSSVPRRKPSSRPASRSGPPASGDPLSRQY